MNSFFKKMYCINLDRREDRLKIVNELFNSNNLEVERHSAFDGKKELSFPYPFYSELAGAISHRDVIQKAKDSNIENVLIFEDDVEFNTTLPKHWELIKTYVPENWDIINFGGNHVGGLTRENIFFHKMYRSYALHMYAVNGKFYDTILNYLNEKIDNVLKNEIIEASSVAADYFIADLHADNNCYVIRPHLAWQRVDYSDIQESIMNYDFLKL